MVLNSSVFSKFPAPAGEFAVCRSLDNHSNVRHWALLLALLVLLTFIFCWTPYYFLGLWYWFSPTMLTEVPPSFSHILFLFGNLKFVLYLYASPLELLCHPVRNSICLWWKNQKLQISIKGKLKITHNLTLQR